MLQNAELKRKLQLCAELPSPAGIALHIIDLCQNPEATLNDIAAMVGHDPAISAKLLRMANSPAYARQRKTENIRQAIALFGLNGTLVLALGFSVVNARGAQPGLLDHNLLWRRALACAISSQILGARLEPAKKEELFLAALLQDIGMLAIERVEPEFYHTLGSVHCPHEQIISYEQNWLTCNHAEVGAWLLQKWKLPDHLATAVARSHHYDSQNRFNQIIAVSSALGDIWWHKDPQAGLQQAATIAKAHLSLSLDELSGIIEATGQQLEEAAATFEIDVSDHVPAELLLEKAKELAGLMTIRTMQETSVLREKTEALTQHNRELKQQAQHDSLTGLYNRARLDQVLAAEYQMACESNFPLTVVFIDLDHFKQINDQHGHNIGDQALIHCARIIQEQIRNSDIMARYGGEEFVVILPGTDASGAQVVCNRMLESLRCTHLFIDAQKKLTVTASIGITVLDKFNEAHGSYELIRQADRALYNAKSSGRDQLRFYGD